MNEVKVNEVYELYQIMTDFGDPLEIFREGIQNSFDENALNIFIRVYEEQSIRNINDIIIDIYDDGKGLPKEKIENFFDVANSSKITSNFIQQHGKHGYKGHGSKVFFNAKLIQICSKTKDGQYWAAELEDPVAQIDTKKKLEYSEIKTPEELNISLPSNFESGFFVRIKAPNYFADQDTRYKLSHIFLRDYCKWYTLAGTVETSYNEELKNRGVKIYLQGLNSDDFFNKYQDITVCDPTPTIKFISNIAFEEISLGHYFPPKRTSEKEMNTYAKNIKSNKASYLFYSNMVYNQTHTVSGISFRLIISFEGYETKRRYDLLLSRQGKQSDNTNHTDSSRYGLWACKGGVPIEKIDDWIEGGKGVGTYSYMQAFVDSDSFLLTANRGSIMNTDIQKLKIIKEEVNRVFKSDKIKKAMEERSELEESYKAITSIEEDGKNLQLRYKASKSRKTITFPDGTTILEPSKKGNNYNESETFVVLLAIMFRYPKFFNFKLRDYNTTKGIDFVVEDASGNPLYIELKGTLTKTINHPFQYIYKFICYELGVDANDVIEDKNPEPYKAMLKVNKNDKFQSLDDNFDKQTYTSYVLQPESANIRSMEIICLKDLLINVLKATIN